jgi:thiol-disulfide isomerase/thioredoxin
MPRVLPYLAAALLAAASFPALAVQPGAAAPSVALPADGGEFRLDAMRGKVVYLDFWASWCGPCKQSFPWMNAMQAKYADKGLVVVAVNLDTVRGDAQTFLKTTPAQFKVAYDPNGLVAQAYAIKGMPSSFLIGRDGRLVAAHTGFNAGSRDELERALQQVLGAQP